LLHIALAEALDKALDARAGACLGNRLMRAVERPAVNVAASPKLRDVDILDHHGLQMSMPCR